MTHGFSFFSDKKVLVTGGTGMIGRPLVRMLVEQGAQVRVVSLDKPADSHQNVEYIHADLRNFDACLKACDGMQFVFHLAGVKGSPAMTAQRPASLFVPTLTFSMNMMEAARRMGIERYLFTSSVGVYAPAEVFYEDDVWKTFPSPHDKFAGWAKRMCELQAEAYKIEYGWDKISIVRPANVYGPFDNFDPNNAMVISSLIHRALSGEDPLMVWGDGSAIRDFIYCDDVARGMLLAVEKGINEPINLGSGSGHSIKEVVEMVCAAVKKDIEVVWDISKPQGDKKRLMDMIRAHGYGFKPQTSLSEGIFQTVMWYKEKQSSLGGARYNPFTEAVLLPKKATV